MYAIRAWVLEHFRLIFSSGMLFCLYKIGETCACTAAMYGFNLPFMTS